MMKEQCDCDRTSDPCVALCKHQDNRKVQLWLFGEGGYDSAISLSGPMTDEDEHRVIHGRVSEAEEEAIFQESFYSRHQLSEALADFRRRTRRMYQSPKTGKK